MSTESKIIEALKLLESGKATQEKCRDICAKLGSLLRNNELGKTQIPVVYYILGRCNEQLINYWGAARAFKKVSLNNNASKKQETYADIFIIKFVRQINEKMLWHKQESDKLWNKRLKMQITN